MKYIECPETYTCAGPDDTLFLGGGISGCIDWQQEMVKLLSGSNITLLNPRRKNFPMDDPTAAEAQIKWEHTHMARTDAILFWFPCETLCPITLYELGLWNFRPKELIIGLHPDYKRKLDVEIQTRLERPYQVFAYSLEDLAKQVLSWEDERKEKRAEDEKYYQSLHKKQEAVADLRTDNHTRN